ncbi:hypothetical protein A6V39_03260 [Candidatus Mycoplasma haematobovis]|uniref:Uncharacterized protein n=1 Tax=Candidatus Mycoplasma haematobovis TaxID=432608 RepID=A0A1A9QBR8_9MOLU|nr:hypothetical protein [Candidatus Mycoplasma haematobovis]OAL09903.1 hypothetical protein A6V39_03260 [Candidatus Mycoplasma haematobovis]
MANTNLAKTAYGLLGTGVLLGAGYIGRPYIFGDKIADLLKVHNTEKQLLTSASPSYSERWKKAWFNYRKDNQNKEKDVWEIGDWDKTFVKKDDIVAPTSFVDACERNSRVSVSSHLNPLYKQVLDWCTSDSKVSIKDLIRDSGKRILNKFDSKTKEDSGWKPLFKRYLTSNKNREQDVLKVSGWVNNPDPANKLENNAQILEDFISKCTALSEKTVENVGDANYQDAVSYCSDDIHAEDLVKESGRKMIDLSKLTPSSDGTANALAREIWQKYIKKNENKDNGEDEWKVDQWHLKKKTPESIPEKFWDNCKNKRKSNIRSVEDTLFEQVKNYCSVESSRTEYIEAD